MAGSTFKVVFVRHGESKWNVANIFTGWHDVDLSDNGVAEAVEAGKCLKEKGYKFDIIFTSKLRRAIRTAWTVCQYSENFAMPILNNWRLNERHYGGLQGMNKAETAAKHGDDQVKIWRRSFDIPPPPLEQTDLRHPCNDPLYAGVPKAALPGAESLKMTIERVLPLWNDQIAPCVMAGKSVMVAAHGNSLRAICMFLKGMTEKEVLEFNIPTAVPLVYELDANLNYVKDYYLMDEAEVAAKIAAVANQGKSGGGGASKGTVCVCGAGNAAHVFIPYFSNNGFDCTVFAGFKDEAERLQRISSENGGILIHDRCDPNNIKEYKALPKAVSKNAADVLPSADYVIAALPSFAVQNVLTDIKPHLKQGATVYVMPGQGGVDLMAKSVLGDEIKAGKVTVAGIFPMPLNCRISEWGKRVELAALKPSYHLASLPAKNAPAAAKTLTQLLGGRKVVVTGSYPGISLQTGNPNIHPARLYGLFGPGSQLGLYSEGKVYPENPLFYETWDDNSSKWTQAICDERQKVWAAICQKFPGSGEPEQLPVVKLALETLYAGQIGDTSSLTTVFRTNDGYKGFRCPMKPVDGGFGLDFENRYFVEDFPDSFATYKGLADLAGVETPAIDEVFLFFQKFMGKEYVKDGKLCGANVNETKSPQAFGVKSLEDLLKD
jgi:2,3-bisphosphoglycerate-dependent phosphoglycerate mutase